MASSATWPIVAGTASASPRTSSARPINARARCSASPGRCYGGWPNLRLHARLAVLHGTDVYFVIEERAPGRPSLITDVGVSLPAPVTASGLAILAELPPRQIRALFPAADSLVQREGRGPTTPTELRRLLDDVRTRGYAVEEGMVTPGLSTVARPVLDAHDHPVASVAVTFPSDADHDVRAAVLEAIYQVVDQLSDRLGGRMSDSFK